MHIWLESAEEKILLDGFGVSIEIQCPSPCCDVCQEEIGQLVDRRIEHLILIKVIDELDKMGEVKVTEWIYKVGKQLG